ncbi:MAG: DUF72 domain-containing protein [Bacteroidetes bacterium]|nr:MAG: DUF72 domain-containing protein [Bacteroidota bacterium]
MKFGKLADIRGVDFSLPPDPEPGRLPGKPAGDFRAYVGLSRWASKAWLGQLYPPGTRQADYLYYYARSFNTIELNSTHYRTPTPVQVEKWRDATPGNFVFCPKVPQLISHYRKLVNCEEALAQFVDSIVHFEDKLGCCFVQLHDSFGPALYPNLVSFLRQWPRGIPLAVEFRHADWFAAGQLLPQVEELLANAGVGTVITDVAGRRDVCHTSLTTRYAMIRFVGNALDATDYQRAEAWIERLDRWLRAGLETLYLFPHEPEDPMAADMGRYWIEGLNRKLGTDLPLPGLDNRPNTQMSLF